MPAGFHPRPGPPAFLASSAPAVLLLARTHWRRGWRSLLALGVLAGLAAGCVLGALALARRTASAPDRLAATTQVEDARVSVFAGEGLAGAVADLPTVRTAWTTGNAVGQLVGADVTYLSLTFGPLPPEDLFTPVVIAGRAADPAVAEEVVISEQLGSAFDLQPGGRLRLAMLLPEEVFAFDTGFGSPDGPTVDLRVTGLLRLPSRGGNGFGPIFAGPAFTERYGELSAGPTVLVRLDEGANARPEFTAGLAQLVDGSADPQDAAAEFGPVRAVFPADEVDPRVGTAQRVLGGGLLLFAAVGGVASLVAAGQALARHASATAPEQRVEAALGLVAAERLLGRLLPVLPAAVLAGTLGGAGVLLAGLREPLGGLRQYEPEPGWLPDPPLAAVGAVATTATLLLLAAVSIRLAGGAPRDGASSPAARSYRLLRHPTAVAGAAFALGRSGRSRSDTVPARTTLMSAAVGVAGIVTVATFAASLDRVETNPARWGWVADFAILDLKEDTLSRLVADPRLRDVQVLTEAPVRIGGAFAAGKATSDRKGRLPPTLIEGRLPGTPQEVALGPRTARELDAGVGDVVPVGSGPRGRSARVTGIAIAAPTSDAERLGASALFTPEGLTLAAESPPLVTALVRAAGDPLPPRARYAESLEVIPPEPPAEIRTLRDLGLLPEVLVAFLVLLAVATLAHALAVTARRRGRDLAALRALGLTRRQVGGVLLVMAVSATVVGTAVGLPLGLLLGRLAWHETAAATGVATDLLVPPLLLAVVPVAILTAITVALLPARRAGRRDPAALLRAE